jgi:hypothetical protein
MLNIPLEQLIGKLLFESPKVTTNPESVGVLFRWINSLAVAQDSKIRKIMVSLY